MKDLLFYEPLKEFMEQIPGGAFLTAGYNGKANTMTIGWANAGIIWGKPILMVMVRYSRYTYELLEKSKEFTVSIPLSGDLKKQLALCGSKSGKDIDKFKEAGLSPVQGKTVAAPIIKECDLFYECKVVYQQAMEPALLKTDIKENFYPGGNYHVLYYGEIAACYKRE